MKSSPFYGQWPLIRYWVRMFSMLVAIDYSILMHVATAKDGLIEKSWFQTFFRDCREAWIWRGYFCGARDGNTLYQPPGHEKMIAYRKKITQYFVDRLKSSFRKKYWGSMKFINRRIYFVYFLKISPSAPCRRINSDHSAEDMEAVRMVTNTNMMKKMMRKTQRSKYGFASTGVDINVRGRISYFAVRHLEEKHS